VESVGRVGEVEVAAAVEDEVIRGIELPHAAGRRQRREVAVAVVAGYPSIPVLADDEVAGAVGGQPVRTLFPEIEG
jgi:hypothetical protein